MENMNDAIEARSEKLARQMNKITDKLNLSDEMLVLSDDVESVVRESIDSHAVQGANSVDLTISNESLLSLEIMSEDFTYVRDTLKEVTENARKVQTAITTQLLHPCYDEDEAQDTASLVASFAELSKAITDAQKLYITSYKDMSITMLNLDKIAKAEIQKNANEVNSGGASSEGERIISTSDLIAEMKELNENNAK